MHVLLVEAAETTSQITDSLRSVANLNFRRSESGEDAFGMARSFDFDMILVSELGGNWNSRDFIARLRSQRIATPIVVLAASVDLDQLRSYLQTGADDYLAMPMSLEEIVARLVVISRRFHGTYSSVIQIGELEIDVLSKEVRCNGTRLQLTRREYDVLEVLALRRGKVVDRDTLLDHLYDSEDEPSGRVIDVFILRLRRKIEEHLDTPAYLSTIRGQGYVLDAAIIDRRGDMAELSA